MATPVKPPQYSVLYRNRGGQKIYVYAWDDTTGAAKTGDAAQITGQIDKDDAGNAATNDVNPTEIDATNHPGWYAFDMTQAETNGSLVLLTPSSSTGNVALSPVLCRTIQWPDEY